jgi:hypothetical protein
MPVARTGCAGQCLDGGTAVHFGRSQTRQGVRWTSLVLGPLEVFDGGHSIPS